MNDIFNKQNRSTQGEHNIYIGYLLPTITEIMLKFEKLENSHMCYCQPLITSLHEGVNKRFEEHLNDEFLIIAVTSHQFFITAIPTKKLETLNLTPTLKKVFIKYNTPLPSSAPVEHVFNIGGAILSKKGGRLSDEHFEKTMLLKCNKIFWK
ncbi:uncharacterized protein LOC113560128 [Rhopalosiphum maidis]|uniref:uncharacterized protein LOC113560128 n=1 Tax=Rhopalosiphum maidis TaxID=43146 RepID=UPI000F008B56|nr:uncharacterized protein LOC113560128 [Rhopalosiphum maidis]